MNRQFRQRLLTSTLFVGVSLIAAPAFAQYTQPTAPQTPSPPDNSATPSNPETTTSPEGQTTVPSTSAEGETVETAQDIVITGSRIPQPNLTSASPVTVVTAQEVKLQGTTRTEDLINSLPQSFAAQGSNISNGATGTATVNLRGLGSSRTLVLVNGRRLMPGDPRSPVADLNFIPAPLIKRVDVLTGGASSVYGADAVSGVVNFIMDTNFRGLRLDAQSSVFMHENGTKSDIIEANEARGFRPPTGTSVNGGAQDVALAFGAGFDDNRGNITAYATYRRQRPVLQSTRDYSFCALSANSQTRTDALDRRFNCSGSATSANGTFFTNVGTFQIEGNQFVPGFTPFNFGPYNFFQRPDERYTLGGFAEYEVSESFKPYLEAMFMDDRSTAQIAPSGNFFASNNVNCDNPLLSDQQRDIICQPAVFDPTDAMVFDGDFNSNFGNLVGQQPIFGPDPDGDGPLEAPLIGFTAPTQFTGGDGSTFTRGIAYIGRRNVEGGGRVDDLRHTAYRLVGGIRGDFMRGLSYDAYYQYGTTVLSNVYLNDFSIRRLGQALDVVTDPTTGQPVCRATLGGTADAGCVPFNIFAAGGVTQDAINFLQTPAFSNGDVKESIANFNVTFQGGEYGLQIPWANRGIGVNVGAEYRKESLNFDTDTAFSTGDLAGQGGPTIGVEGSFDVRELFTEVELPIVNDSFIHEFSIQAGYRYSDYKVAGNSFDTHTYKLAAELAPVQDVRLRASYNRAVRAPNVVELFSAQAVGLGLNDDPCAGPAAGGLVNGLTQAQCALIGVPAAQFGRILANPAQQYNSFNGGNPNLEPEKADSYTAGIVLQPRFIPGLAVTVDYFDIRLKNAIGVIGADTIVQQCLATADPFFCDRINRAPGSGSLFLQGGFVTDLNTNVGGVSTKGVDINASYARQIGRLGSLNLSLVGTYLDELISNPIADTKFDCSGFFGTQCGTPNPEWRHKFRAGFTLPNGIGFSGQWRHFSRVKIDQLSNDIDLCPTTGDPPVCNPDSTSAGLFPANRRLKAMNYFDIAMQARVSDRFNFRIGANNVFDTEPPIAGSQVIGAGSGNGNTYPQVYDSLGRYLFAGITVDY